MRIIFLARSLLYYTFQLANALAEQGNDVMMIATDNVAEFVGVGEGDRQEQFRKLLHPKISLEWVHIPASTSPRTLGANLRCIARVTKLIKGYRADILHVHDVADYRLCTAIALTRRLNRLVVTVHDAELHPGDTANKAERLRPWLRKAADGIIVHGEDVKQRLMAVSGVPEGKIEEVPIGSYVFYRRWLSGKSPTEKKLLFFGRIREYKGLEYLIKAAPIVCRQVPEAKFVIAGSGPEWPRCKAMIENPDSFILHEGDVNDLDVVRFFEESAAVVMPYIEASQSGVVAIAYALGKPVVITNVGSIPEVVEDGVTGFIVPPRDVNALAEAIIKILTDDDLRETMGRNAYQRAVTDLSWDESARKTMKVYERALKASRKDAA